VTDASIRWVLRGLWTIVVLFFLLSGAAAYEIHRQLVSPSGLYCANCVTDIFGIILNFAGPIVMATNTGLAYLMGRTGGRVWTVAIAGLLSIASIAAFVSAGTSFFYHSLPSHKLSNIIWWMF
jgi:hypothetical protein